MFLILAEIFRLLVTSYCLNVVICEFFCLLMVLKMRDVFVMLRLTIIIRFCLACLKIVVVFFAPKVEHVCSWWFGLAWSETFFLSV